MRKGGKNGNKNDNQNCRSLWGVDDQFDTSRVCDLVHQKHPEEMVPFWPMIASLIVSLVNAAVQVAL